MNELTEILKKFAQSSWDLIALPAQEWLKKEGSKEGLIMAIKEAKQQCGNCGCEFDPLYERALSLLIP